MKTCPKCGFVIENDNAKFCKKCGAKQPEIVVEKDEAILTVPPNNDGILLNGSPNRHITAEEPVNKTDLIDRPSKPATNLIWSIICISICLPFGVLALAQSVKVDSLYSNGEYEAAEKASEKSKKWAMWCLWAWLIFFAILIIIAIANQ